MPKLTVNIVKATIVPSRETITTFLKRLTKELKANKNAAKEFVKNPNAFLAQRGIPTDVRREILTEEGFKLGRQLAAEGCGGYSCVSTGNCCWNTGKALADELVRVYPAMKTSLNKVLIQRIR